MQSPEACAVDVLEVVPLIMRNIRREMRSHRTSDLSVPQFRTLAFLNNNEGASLSDVAEYIGLTLPSASKLVDGLVGHNIIIRKSSEDDRRRIVLSLSSLGKDTLQVSYQATLAYLVQLMTALSDADRQIVMHAMQLLKPLFLPVKETGADER